MADHASGKSPASNRVEGPEAVPKLEIAIRKGHVRRAIRAADSVFVAAKSILGGEIEQGVVLMTAVLLVERLATASGREPNAVLSKMADCFAVKRELAKTSKSGLLA
jgi:hypothetical protein